MLSLITNRAEATATAERKNNAPSKDNALETTLYTKRLSQATQRLKRT